MNTLKSLSDIVRKKETIGFIIALSFAYLVFPNFFYRGIYSIPSYEVIWNTLDPSWIITLNKVNMDNMIWGKDFVFTYGPLSYLSTRVAWGVSKYHFILFDLFVLFNFFCVFYKAYVHSNNKGITVLLIVSASILLPAYFGSGLALVLSAFLIFWIRESLEKNNFLFYLMQLIIMLLLFFLKFNTGLVSFVFVFLGLVYQVIVNKQNKLLIAVYALLPVIGIIAFSKLFNVAFWEYLQGGLNAISGYNDVMYLDEPYENENTYGILFIFLSVSVIAWKVYLEKQSILKNLLVLFLFSVSIFILYKQAFVRGDIQHILEFFKYALVLILCIRDFHYYEVGRNSNAVIISLVFIAIFFAKRKEDHLLNLKNRVFKPEYTKGYENYTDSAGIFLFPNNNQIPQPIKDKIGNKTIDIYPWNALMLIENRLNFTPRPVFQSYAAYTPYLENLNFNFYNSQKAPKFLLYEFDAIDSRYPLFDESKLNLLVLKNYTCIDTFLFGSRPVLVLEKKEQAKNVKLERIKEFEIGIKDSIVPKPDSYYELYVLNTLKGKLISTLKHAPEMYLVITTKNGQKREFRTSKKLLETGIFSNYYFNSVRDFYKYIHKDSLKLENEVATYSLRTLDSNATLFKDKIKVIEYKIN